MSEPTLPRLFTPTILYQYMDGNEELTLPMLQTIIHKQQDIIDKQCKIITSHGDEIDTLIATLSEIMHILNGRQFMNRSVSFESTE